MTEAQRYIDSLPKKRDKDGKLDEFDYVNSLKKFICKRYLDTSYGGAEIPDPSEYIIFDDDSKVSVSNPNQKRFPFFAYIVEDGMFIDWKTCLGKRIQ